MTQAHPDRRSVILGLVGAIAVAGPLAAKSTRIPRDHGVSTRKVVEINTSEAPGTIIISNDELLLWRVLNGGKAEQFEISVGREGFTWTGTTIVGRKTEWPEWRPPAEMRKRDTTLPTFVPSGPYNPLGARALYLYSGGRDTLYRIHGTNSAGTVGSYETSGCFRMTNTDVMYLFEQVQPGAKVVVY